MKPSQQWKDIEEQAPKSPVLWAGDWIIVFIWAALTVIANYGRRRRR